MRLSHKYYYSNVTQRQHLYMLLMDDFVSATVLYYSNCESLALDLLIGPLARHLHLYSAHKHSSWTVIPHRRWVVLNAGGLFTCLHWKWCLGVVQKHTLPVPHQWCMYGLLLRGVSSGSVCIIPRNSASGGDGLQKPSRCEVCQLWDHFNICASGKNKKEKSAWKQIGEEDVKNGVRF